MSLRRFVSQSSWYFGSHIFTTILGLISFPLWTRVLTVREYGIYALLGVAVAFVSTIARFGLPKAGLRFYPQFESGKRNQPISTFYTTLCLGAFVLGVIVQALYFAVLFLLQPAHVGGHDIYVLYMWAGAILFLGPVVGVLFTFLRAEERPRPLTFISVSRGYLGLGVSLLFVVGFSMGLKGIYLSGIVLGPIIVGLLLFWLRREKKLIISTFSLAFLIEAIRFGFPLIAADLSNAISAIGDRYVLQYFMGTETVGLYSAGYGVSARLTSLFSVMMVSVVPIYLSIWEKDGREKTEEFLSNVLDIYMMFALPAIFFFSFFGGDILTLFASEKYQAAGVVLPYLVTPIVLHGAISIYTAGLYISKKTQYVLYFTVASGILNIILNIILIPILGITGAALATLISYLVLIVLSNILSMRFITLRLNFPALFKYLGASVFALILMRDLHFEIFFGVLIKLLIGGIIYGVSVLIIDRKVRQRLRLVLKV